MAKTPLGDFKVTTIENSLLLKQAVTMVALRMFPISSVKLFYNCNIYLYHTLQAATIL